MELDRIDLKDVLHPRVLEHCEKLFADGHFKHAAHEAMTQVELALKEKLVCGNEHLFGAKLVTSLLGPGRGLKLQVPLGDEMQDDAKVLFEGAFRYYRNYTAHDGAKIDRRACLRVMVLASELLELVGASNLSFADVGGVEGLVKTGAFSSKEVLLEFLSFIDGQQLLDDDLDCIGDGLYARGFDDVHVQAVIDTGLVDYTSEETLPAPDDFCDRYSGPESIGYFRLSELGKRVLAGGE